LPELAFAVQDRDGDRVPVAVVRGLDVRGDGRAADLVIPPETDLFR